MSTSELEGFGGALDLSGANSKGFEPAESGTYDCELFSYEWGATKGGQDAKMPAGTPRLNIQLKCVDEPYVNKRFFDGFNFPPADYDAEKKAQAEGFVVRFLMAMGVSEDDIKKNKKFNLNDKLNELIGEPVRVTVGLAHYEQGAQKGEPYNPVKGYKPIGSGEIENGAGGKLL